MPPSSSPLKPNGLLSQPTLAFPLASPSSSSSTRRPGDLAKQAKKHLKLGKSRSKVSDTPSTRLKPISGDLFYSPSPKRAGSTNKQKSPEDARSSKRRRLSDEQDKENRGLGSCDDHDLDGTSPAHQRHDPWKPTAFHRAPRYGLVPSTPTNRPRPIAPLRPSSTSRSGNRASAFTPSRPGAGRSFDVKGEIDGQEEEEFLKALLDDIDVDPTGGISSSPARSEASGGVKRKRLDYGDEAIGQGEPDTDHEGDEFGDEGWDWSGLVDVDMINGGGQRNALIQDESLGAVEMVLAESVLHKAREERVETVPSAGRGLGRQISSIEISYEEKNEPSVAQAATTTVKLEIEAATSVDEAKPKVEPPVQEGLDDLEDYFPFDIPLSQESFLDHLDDTAGPDNNHPTPPPVYPIIHPLVHPPSRASLSSIERYAPTPWARCSVISVCVPEEEEEGNRWGWAEKVVKAVDVKIGREYEVRLREEAGEMSIFVGDIVNIISPLVEAMATPMKTPTKAPARTDPFSLHPSLPARVEFAKEDISPRAAATLGTESLRSGDDSLIEIIISHKHPDNHLIHHPDYLLPMTSLAGALGCRRKPLVQTLLKSGAHNATTKPLLYGNILHELLQEALRTREFDHVALKKMLEQILQRPQMQLDMWAAELGMEEVRLEVWEKATAGLLGFGQRWIGPTPLDDSTLHNSLSRLSISGLHDIEESIWSPKWGMKGKVDASVHANLVPAKSSKSVYNTTRELVENTTEDRPMPFEIKTGRAVGVMEHRAQTMLYTLLMEERYQTKIDAGLLYYTQTDTILQVNAAKPEIRSLLAARNELAGYLSRKRVIQQTRKAQSSQVARTQKSQRSPRPSQTKGPASPGMVPSGIPLALDMEDLSILPPTTENPRECRTCYASDGCMLYRKTVENVATDPEDPLAEIYDRKAGHLTEEDVDFFTKWEHLVTLEEQDIIQNKNQTWTMTAPERERSGKCFAEMVITDHVDQSETTLSRIARHIYTFARSGDSTISGRPSFLNGHIGKNDPISLSIEPDLLSIAVGFVVELTPTEVRIGTNQKLDVSALLERTRRLERYGQDYQPVFRLDKDEMLSGTTRMRNNIAQLFYSEESKGDSKRRDLVVRLEEPRFEDVWAPDPEEIPEHLNQDQRNAMFKVLTAKDYACILGMPGTGKTSTIAEIILALVKRGKSVLLTSYTHSAVDTILTKLVNSDHKILRLGNIEKVHPDVRHLTLEAFSDPSSISQLEDTLMSPQIVATTCLSIDHPLFIRRRFDYCIVDEASQITLPTCLGPLRFADTFVLVGDHFQLPPIVKNVAARRGGLDTSLFRLLTDAHPEATVDLGFQYRMNQDIMAIPNKLIYSGRLKCGSEEVRDQKLVLPREIAPCGCSLAKLLKEEVRCVFVNTDKLGGQETRVGDLVQNPIEGNLVHRFVSSLVARGIKQEDIGVITPYRQQIKLLSALIHEEHPLVEVLTADKSQGRDKDCIVLSMVRSNDIGNIGELLRDWRRINVSLTRAKKKLVIFGSRGTLQTDRLMSEFFDLMQENGWIMDLLKADGVCNCGTNIE